jgi:hypothetical protein
MRLSVSFPYRISRSGLTAAIGLVSVCVFSTIGLMGCLAMPAAAGAAGLFGASGQPSASYASPAAVSVIQPVVLPTDAQMTCDQLFAASSSMDQVIASESAAPHPAPSAGLTDAVMHTAATMAVGALSGFAPGATYLAPAATGLEQQQIAQEQIQAQSQAQGESQAQMAINNAQQRKMYLATLMQQKKCGEYSSSGN